MRNTQFVQIEFEFFSPIQIAEFPHVKGVSNEQKSQEKMKTAEAHQNKIIISTQLLKLK